MRVVLVCLAVTATGCGSEPLVDGVFTSAEWDLIQTFRLDREAPLPCPGGATSCEAEVQLGKALFFDPRFSGELQVAPDGFNGGLGQIGETGKIACTSCHDPSAWFTDTRSRPNASSLGTGWTKRNTPGLVDAGYLGAFTWTGKYASLAGVLELAVTSKAALNTTKQHYVDVLATYYRADYDAVFSPALPSAISAQEAPAIFDNAARAIAAYESRLVSGPSPFDLYAAGNDAAGFSDAAKRGLGVFIGRGLCSECHTGPMFSDLQFHNTGIEQRGEHAPPIDHGRAEVTSEVDDDGRFRTPTLRHVAQTAPYMHAGQLATLAEVIDHYRWGGLPSGFVGTRDPRIVPLDLDDQDARDLEAFLTTLTGTPVPSALTGKP